jgi:D-glycero-alpha-D-manno-heptose-7-phosphate kinase
MLITQTPLRISIAGGGTDLAAYYAQHGGAVLSTAIDKYVYVILNKRFDDKIYISYSRKEIVDHVDEIEHELVREALKTAGIEKGIEIAIMADIPSSGSGLGSSSSLTVGLLNAFHTYQGRQVPAEQLAQEACEIEINRCGKPIGMQDQYIAAYGGLQFIEFNPDGSTQVTPVNIGHVKQNWGACMMLFFTNITRSADVILKEQRSNTEQRIEFLHKIKALAYEARDAVNAEDFDAIGDILKRNWALKKGLASGITKPEIDAMVKQAAQGGAVGCKICGAGGGGFLLTYCSRHQKNHLRRSMSAYREMPFFLERYGSKVNYNAEGYEWN